MKEKSLKLVEPIIFGSETIEELKVRKPIAKDLRKFPAEAKNLGEMLDFAAHLCGQPAPIIDQLCLEDAVNLFEVISNFLPDGLKTGPRK